MTVDAPSETAESPVRTALAVLRRIPGTLAVTGIVLVVGALTGALWSSALESGLVDRWGWGLDAFAEGQWYTVLVGAAISPEPWMYALILATFCVGGGFLEYRYGTLRMLAAVLGTHLAAVLVVALMFLILEQTSLDWAQELARVRDVGLSNGGFGAVGAMTAGMPLLWRRRVRLIGSLYCVAMILYAAEIWDFTHAAAFWIGILAGPWVVGRAREQFDWRFGPQEVRDTAAVLVAFGALHQLLIRLWPGEGGILRFGENADDPALSTLALVAASVLSLTFAYALHNGRRGAWWYVTVVSVITALAGPFAASNPSDWLDIALDVVLLVLLIGWRRHFRVTGDRRGKLRVWKRGLVTLAALMTFTVAAIMALSHQITPQPDIGDALAEAIVRIFGGTTGLEGETTAAKAILGGIGIVWFIAFAIFVAALLLTSRRHETDGSTRDRFIELQRTTTGMTSIGYMARWEGIDHWISDDGTAGFGFKQVGNTVIVLSDPAGHPDDLRRNYAGFAEFCRSRGWRLGYFAVSERARSELSEQGWKSLQVAEDTVVRLPDLAFTGKKWQDVRSAINRAKREGVTMRVVRYAEAPRGLKDQMEAISAQWAGDKSLPEMGFTLGDLPQADDPNVEMHLAVDEDGTVHGMTSWMPVYREGFVVGWTIDIMKRRLDDGVMSGVMEFLIAESAVQYKEAGYEFISLSAAPLSYSGEVDNSVEKLLDILADKMEPYYGFTSLERFKAKFKPEHRPLYLAYQDEVGLPGIALGILRAYLPDATAADLVKAAVSRPD
ncbi:DUF2156 domain-containing protein [Demequina sp. SYSU T00039]|uniref:DUF2156 domain-containing protein n=1 Tax=Demequina lignilytica TaxID=3051663 RepID=A0AAW7M4L1_9MICO|nr:MULTISPECIES: DUF2156 domain-containing protein [unclassified Demequina]MDN4477794.1 DUF2156 domain-containing protein [Demequina sp. SYSU T00039-1]MDN4487703.1 DUF2156 domain-containing protein [Demequina sp. SYSU T00039]MDN4491414.1 DUF2156 domain-containing protein [Demequina sp. SYSU T00068]